MKTFDEICENLYLAGLLPLNKMKADALIKSVWSARIEFLQLVFG